MSTAAATSAMRRSSALLGLQRSSSALVFSPAPISRNFSSSNSSNSGSHRRDSGSHTRDNVRKRMSALAAATAGTATLGEDEELQYRVTVVV